ncbi:unnamed protein product [Rotaria sordida]|uniref:Uncharacterized protein n=1 Tax=Rotaria sordida TaxID=392033 RepID=A0A815MWX6_9BILA|nr:unnamed protein product [Rotaria sordida]CAF1426340.1 unnamed protein product [Rotaria sordida]
MHLLNIAKHLFHLAQTEYGSENSPTTNDEIFTAQRLFEVLKSFKDSYFSELYTYDTLEYEDEYDETTDEDESDDEIMDEEESDNEMDDYDENEQFDLKSRFTLEEMENIIEWVDQHPNARFATISNRFKKIKHRNYITRFRQYIEKDGTRLQKLKQIKEFMFNKFYRKRTIEKEAIHDADLELYAIQKARELNWDTFKAGKTFINSFKRENRISSRRYNKIITRTKPKRKVCSLNDAHNWIESKRSLIAKYSANEILNSDHCSFQQEYIPPRTLSFTGERTTEVAVKKKYNTTHSYTIQPVTLANGHLLEKFLLILQEKENQFGQRVEKKLIIPPNVVVKASKSGKSSGEKHHAFLNEILRPLVGKKFLLFLDCWKTQADLTKFRAVFPNQDSQLLIFPEGSTGYIQPQDAYDIEKYET